VAIHSDISKKIGIPRAFYYYSYPRLWETLFQELGAVPVISRPSTQRTVEKAAAVSETEHCLPNKLFDAHLADLVGRVDMVFVPRILSTLKGHLACPKLGALADAARAEVAKDAEVLTIDIDENKKPLVKTLVELGRKLDVSKKAARAAAQKAVQAMGVAHAMMDNQGAPKEGGRGPQLLILGHPYTLYDKFLAGPILRKLANLRVQTELISFSKSDIPASFIRWGVANKMYHRLTTLKREECAGVIQISFFNCGCDSMLIEIFRRQMQEKGIPYMVLVLDEHFGQAGVETRLEAFVDSLTW
jgi:predicted nucleotide-binding protein (sugar kinase/HSP70/actin superfamily)